MEENKIQSETIVSDEITVPTKVDNTEVSSKQIVSNPTETTEEVSQVQTVGESKKDPTKDLILGKFKSVEELTKAYEELQKHQGSTSEELGELRKSASRFNDFNEKLKSIGETFASNLANLNEIAQKFDKPEYFQDQSFVNMFSEAYLALDGNLDTDRFVKLLDGYVSSRISAYEKKNAAFNETDKIISSMGYNKNTKSSFNPPKKKLDEMTPKEIDEMLDRLI